MESVSQLKLGLEEAVMMLAYRLVRLIETHSDSLAGNLLSKVQKSEYCQDYCSKVPEEELRERVYEIYRHLGHWLLGKTELDVEQRYQEIGRARSRQGVTLSTLIWAITLTKENLWEFLKGQTSTDRPAEVFGEMEMLQLLEQFFDRAVYHAAQGYEGVTAEPMRHETGAAL
jgi:hypothetical protein